MNKGITYRQKLKYLGIGTGLLLLICYQFSFSKTIGEYWKHKQFRQLRSAETTDENSIQLLQSRNRMLDAVLNKFILDTADQSKNLLNIAGDFCNANDLKLIEYKPYPKIQSDSVNIVTRSITVSGSFINCLHLLYYLETKSNAGRISSVNYKTVTAPGNNGTQLTCTIFLQNLILSDNETE